MVNFIDIPLILALALCPQDTVSPPTGVQALPQSIDVTHNVEIKAHYDLKDLTIKLPQSLGGQVQLNYSRGSEAFQANPVVSLPTPIGFSTPAVGPVIRTTSPAPLYYGQWRVNDGRSIKSHLQAVHGVNTYGMSESEAYRVHDDIHNAQQNSQRRRARRTLFPRVFR